jgi:transcription termination factor 2
MLFRNDKFVLLKFESLFKIFFHLITIKGDSANEIFSNARDEESSESVEISETDDELDETNDESSNFQNSLLNNEANEQSNVIESSISEADKSLNTDDSSVDADDDNDSSDDADNDNDSSDEEIVRPIKKLKKHINRIEDDDDEEEDEEEKKDNERRRTLYEMQPDGDTSITIEDRAFSKATRLSIHGDLSSRKSVDKNDCVVSSDSSDCDIIISDDDNDDQEENDSIAKKMSSPENEKSFNSSITSKLSSTLRTSSVEPSNTSNASNVKRISQSNYEALLKERDNLQTRYDSTKRMIDSNFHTKMPDGGLKLQKKAEEMLMQINAINEELKNIEVDQSSSAKSQIINSFKSEQSSLKENSMNASNVINLDDSAFNKNQSDGIITVEDVKPKYLGKIGMRNFEAQKALTVEKLQGICDSLDQRPAEDVVETQPKHLKIELMKHQLHAIAFMVWREKQKNPRGGILADDMVIRNDLH